MISIFLPSDPMILSSGYEDMSAGGGQGGYGAPKADKEAAGGYQGGGAGVYQSPHLRK